MTTDTVTVPPLGGLTLPIAGKQRSPHPATHPSILVKTLGHNDLRGIKAAFINMPLRESTKPNTPPQGPGLLAARLRLFGAQPFIIDLNAYRIKDDAAKAKGLPHGRHFTLAEAEKLIEAYFNLHGEPDIIALSGMITTLRWQEEIVRIARRLAPHAFLVTGGGLATEIKTGLFSWMPELDAVAHSEGDDTILLIARDVKYLKEHGGLRNLSRIAPSPYYVGDFAGRPKFMYGGDRPEDLDALPFAAWDLLHEDPYGNRVLEWYIETPVWGLAANNSSATPFTMKRSLTTVSSRGCPYACAFCYRGAQGERMYGMRGAENLLREATWLKETYDIDFLGFPDDNFAVDRRRIDVLPRIFKDLGLRWGTHARLDEADDRADFMAKAGCVYIGFGAESASEHVLTRMEKRGFILKNGLTRMNGFDFPTTMVNGVKKCKDAGIHANCTWIMAYPGERLLDLKTSVAFILWQIEHATAGLTPGTPAWDNARASINQRMFTATAYPGTAMFRDPKVRGLLGEHFKISFDERLEPVCNEDLRQYVLELDDATKVLHGSDGKPLNFGDMPEEEFLEAREYVDQGTIEKILDM